MESFDSISFAVSWCVSPLPTVMPGTAVQLAACGRIGILRDVAVGELDTAGHAVVVVLNKHDALARIGNQRAVGIVLECAAVRCVAVEVEGSVVLQLVGIVTNIVYAVALEGDYSSIQPT